MPGPWITVADLRHALAADLGVPVEELGQSWENVLPRALASGYADCREAMAARDYTPTQLDLWDRRVEFNTEQALFWALALRATLSGFDVNVVKLRDRREALKTTLVTANGVPLFPVAGADGTGGLSVAGGRMSEQGYRTTMETEF